MLKPESEEKEKEKMSSFLPYVQRSNALRAVDRSR
jgi:hypothetical protein